MILQPDWYAKDHKMTQVSLSDMVLTTSSSQVKTMYDDLEFSPLKVRSLIFRMTF